MVFYFKNFNFDFWRQAKIFEHYENKIVEVMKIDQLPLINFRFLL